MPQLLCKDCDHPLIVEKNGVTCLTGHGSHLTAAVWSADKLVCTNPQCGAVFFNLANKPFLKGTDDRFAERLLEAKREAGDHFYHEGRAY